MLKPIEGETRQEYLLRATIQLLKTNPCALEMTTDYDETTCDGYCLVDEIEAELSISGVFTDNK